MVLSALSLSIQRRSRGRGARHFAMRTRHKSSNSWDGSDGSGIRSSSVGSRIGRMELAP